MSARLAASELRLAIGGRTLCETLSFAVAPGQRWAVIGPNGAGKTTLLRTLAGLATPAAGSVLYDGIAIDSLSSRQRARLRAFLPQDSDDAFPATVLETVLIGRHPHVQRFAWEGGVDLASAREALARVGLPGLEARDVRTLSGGERRRVAIAALLAQDAPLMLLDEPSSHLDLGQQAAMLDLLGSLARVERKSIVMVLHDLHLAARGCDHVVAIGDGRAIAGPAADLLHAQPLSALFRHTLVELAGAGGVRTFVPAASNSEGSR